MDKLPERYGLRIDAFSASVERLITCESTAETKPVGVSKSSVIRRKIAKYRYLLVRGNLSIYQRRRVERQLRHNERKLDALASSLYDAPKGVVNRPSVSASLRIADGLYCPLDSRVTVFESHHGTIAPYNRVEMLGCLDRNAVERVKRVKYYCAGCKRVPDSRRALRAISKRIEQGLDATCPNCGRHTFRKVR